MSSILLKFGLSLAVSFEAYPAIQNTVSLPCSCTAECTSLLAKMKTLLFVSRESFLCSLWRAIVFEIPTHDACSVLTSQMFVKVLRSTFG